MSASYIKRIRDLKKLKKKKEEKKRRKKKRRRRRKGILLFACANQTAGKSNISICIHVSIHIVHFT